MQPELEFLLIFVGSTVLSIALLQLFRRAVPQLLSSEDHGIAGHFLGTVCGLYGVLLAFVVVMVWGQFQEARVIATREANQIGDLVRLARGLPEPAQTQMRRSLIAYEQVVVAKEWADMAERKENMAAWAALDNVWTVYREFQPQTLAQVQIYQVSLSRLADLSDARRLRLLSSRAKVPPILWALLILGAVITIAFTYLFRLHHVGAQLMMTASLAGLITFILFLIMEFDQPFKGAIRVHPEVFERELQRMLAPSPSSMEQTHGLGNQAVP